MAGVSRGKLPEDEAGASETALWPIPQLEIPVKISRL
jgi:hypothetical protein